MIVNKFENEDNINIENSEKEGEEEIGHNPIMLDTRYHSKSGTFIDQSVGKNS